MATTTKKELVERITERTKAQRQLISEVVQNFLDEIVTELADGNRIEFRQFGVFYIYHRRPRLGQNPKTLEKVRVPAKKVVKFKTGSVLRAVINKQDNDPKQI